MIKTRINELKYSYEANKRMIFKYTYKKDQEYLACILTVRMWIQGIMLFEWEQDAFSTSKNV